MQKEVRKLLHELNPVQGCASNSSFTSFNLYSEVDEKVRRDIFGVAFTASRPNEMIITFFSHHAHRRT